MGEISSKIRIELLNAKKSKVIDFQMLKEIKAQSKERETRDKKVEEEYKDQDALFQAYSWMIRLFHDLTEDLSPMPQLNPYFDLIEEKSEEYMPSGPPMSPLTSSYWNYWIWFDFKYGRDHETLASIILDLADIIPYSDEFKTLLTLASQSRMGIYEHQGFDGDKIKLEELITGKNFSVICPAGYRGEEERLWFVRLLPHPLGSDQYSMVATTPYVLILQTKGDWLEFFDRNGFSKSTLRLEETLYEFMKFGPKKKRFYWHEFVMDSYATAESDHIFLTGLPDIPETLPHNKKSTLRFYRNEDKPQEVYISRECEPNQSLLLTKQRKASDILLEYFEPVFEGMPKNVSEKKILEVLRVPICAWNASVLDEANPKKQFIRMLFDNTEVPHGKRAEYDAVMRFWLKRKEELFPNEPWSIRDVSFVEKYGEKRFRAETSLPNELSHMAPKDWIPAKKSARKSRVSSKGSLNP